MARVEYEEQWYAIETSRTGDDDWFAMGGRDYPTVEAAKEQIANWKHVPSFLDWEYRVVRKTLTVEVVEGVA